MTGIYKITNKINNKIYVGQSINIERRYKEHIYKAFDSKEIAYNSAIHQAMRKYGIDNFELFILEECEAHELDEKEKEWIIKLNSIVPNGYNIIPGGQSNRKIKKCLNCGKKEIQTNRKYCDDCYEQLKQQGAFLTLKVKNRPSKEKLEFLLQQNNGNFEKVGRIYGINGNSVRKWCKNYGLSYHSKDYKKKTDKIKIEQRKKVKKINIKTNEDISIYNSINDAARDCGVKKGTHITECCKGKIKSAYGYRWEYCD